MKIGLVGWGLETQSAYRYFGAEHDYVIGCEEMRSDFPDNNRATVYALSEKRPPGLAGNATDLSYLEHFDDCDLIIFQPSARKNLERRFPDKDIFWTKAKTIQHVFFEESPTKNIIGITGTKGKGTTTTLTAKMLEACGKTVHIGGNIGVPVLDLLPFIQEDDWVVLELSSFQLYKFPYSPHIAVHLMMVPEHIDEWHITFDDYLEAKSNIFAHQQPDNIAVYLYDNDHSLRNVQKSSANKIPFMTHPGAHIDSGGYISIDGKQIIHKDKVGLIGAHNLENICAALTAVWQVSQDVQKIAEVIRDFKSLEHRLEFVAEVEGVKYYDDSFGTTPNTAVVAFEAITTPKVVIVGGHDKGTPFDELAERLVKEDIKYVVFIGSTAQKIYDLAIQKGMEKTKAIIKDDGNSWQMTEIVEAARKVASPGDSVVLSTGCSSFGLFIDYKDRGNQFKTAVKALL